MEISRKCDYALRMLAELIQAGEGSVVSVRQAAEKNGVPYSFARSIQHDLVRADIVESARGSHGGMRLAVDPHELTIREVVEAIQGPIMVATCDSAGADGGPCERMPECHFNPLWCEAQRILAKYLSSVSLWDVVVERRFPFMPKDEDFRIAQGPGPRQADYVDRETMERAAV